MEKDFKISKKILHLDLKLKFKYLDRIVRAFDFYPFKNNFGYPFILANKKKIFVRKIIFCSKSKHKCQKKINNNTALFKFSNMYVVLKKILQTK